ncbi:Acetyltransferase, GNAT family [Olavius sp. associated proteobacterium Delta 1]|nr:Acetyltransferase, GNAT family [Olavius sp. associated proteobacterium Delta 1]
MILREPLNFEITDIAQRGTPVYCRLMFIFLEISVPSAAERSWLGTRDMTVTIRNAVPDEAGLLTDLALRSKAYWGYSDEFMEACREELSVPAINIASSRMHYSVAEHHCNIVGFYAIERLSGSEFELNALFVEPRHIGSGVGRALILTLHKLLSSSLAVMPEIVAFSGLMLDA